MSGSLRPTDDLPNIYLYRDPVDFRKSYRGLVALVELELGHNVFAGNLYAFTNRRHDKIKCLLWEDNGFVLCYMALSDETFHWPKTNDDVVSLSCQEINWQLNGYDISRLKPHKKLHYEASF